MMSKVSFEDIGAVVATFALQEGVKGGQTVKVTGSGQVGPCASGDPFCGVALEPRWGCGAVQVKGFVSVKTGETLTPGWAELVADGTGGVRAAREAAAASEGQSAVPAEQGVRVLVVSTEPDGSAVLCL